MLESKATRVFHIFKPKEVIVDEYYMLGLTLHNRGDTQFNGGKIEAMLSYPLQSSELSCELKSDVPTILPNKSEKIQFEQQKAESSGKTIFRVKSIVPNDASVNVECCNIYGENLLNRLQDNVLTFSIASREEIYQRYSVVVAIFFSVIAMVVSIINAIASILTLFR